MSVADIHPQQVMGRYVSACDPNKFVLDCSGLTSAAYRHRMHIRRQRGFPLVADIHPQPVVGRCVSAGDPLKTVSECSGLKSAK